MDCAVGDRRVVASTGGRGFDKTLPTVVLLHGAGMNHTIWAFQARTLAHHGRNVLAFDFPGHGGSAGPALETIEVLADWLLRALATLDVACFRLAGHSMGSLVALEAAARAGAACEALALLGFVPQMRVHPDLLGAARAGAHLASELIVAWSFGLKNLTGGNPTPGVLLPDAALRLIEQTPAPSLAADLAACDRYQGALAAASAVRCPVLLLSGAQDRMTPAKQAEAFTGNFAQARSIVLRDCGHMLMVEQPVAVLDSLRAIL
ncbi:MAG: alpha/beta fold hydrolase [Alphaproteobacteria bacterium]|nr:alpha/beta fold hydrolase [Alphaproteobacteria bacterium]